MDPINAAPGDLMDDKEAAILPPKQGDSSRFAAIFNLTNTVVGCGILTLPYACRESGLLVFLILLVAMSALSYLTMLILVKCTEVTGEYTYKDLAKGLLGKRFGGILIETLIVIYTLGCCISFGVIVGDYTAPVFAQLIDPSSVLAQRWFVVIFFACLTFLPLSLPKSLTFLQYFSLVSVLCVVFAVVAVLIRLVAPFQMRRVPMHLSQLRMGPQSISTLFAATPLISVAFAAQYNVQQLFGELKRPTFRNMNIVCLATMALCLAGYALMGVLGYATFRGATPSNVLTGYCALGPDMLAYLAKMGMSLTAMFSFPLTLFPARKSLENIFSPKKPFSTPVHIILTTAIVALCCTVAILVGDMSVVLDFSGALAGSTIVYIFPACFAFKYLCKNWRHKAGAIALGLLGFALLVLGLRSAIIKAIAFFSQKHH
eukprot:gnl/Trimastix_PCT/2759.p1 GENE.gnl/Trimastix_PCT/2759~~gnl/Trimastix_PCT/2759.p1  ORF type:complete len:439 (-),score=82.42 gnl/Trimastix_PCT/2759:530-1819(-)